MTDDFNNNQEDSRFRKLHDTLKDYHEKDVADLKKRLIELEYEFRIVRDELAIIRKALDNESAITKNLSDNLIRFEVSVNKINELSQNYYNMLTELQDIKINRSVDELVLKGVKFVAAGIVVIVLGIIFALIFTGTPKL